MNVLFVTWDGPQTNYLESLFLPIFEGLLPYGFKVHVLQFTWGDKSKIKSMQNLFYAKGLKYEHINVCRKFGALGYLGSIISGQYRIRKIISQHDIDAVMPRSSFPALATLLALRKSPDLKFIFDADGLPLDERVDFSGLSSSGFSYRLLRDIEAEAVRKADVVLTRSKSATPILLARAGPPTLADKFHVVSNGRSTDKFKLNKMNRREQIRKELGVSLNAPLLVYAGSLGKQYCLDEMFIFFSRVKEKCKEAKFLILSGDLTFVEEKLILLPHLNEAVICRSVRPNDVPGYLGASDLGFALRKNSFSMQAVAPIKIGEYLLCGLPVIATKGIGDTQVIDSSVGRLVTDYRENNFQPIVDWFVGDVLINRDEIRQKCREVGLANFSLSSSVSSYLFAFRSLDAK